MATPVSSGQVSETVAYVERELDKMWATPDATTGGEAGARVRASTMNLVVVTSPGELERLRGSTDDLAQTHAGRVFLVTLDGRIAPWELGAAVSGVCRADGGASVCSDRIELAFGASAATRASSVVSALALSEVPVVVEAAAGAPAPLVDELARRCDRVVVDSALLPAARIADVVRLSHAAVADRAWVRTFTWRDLCARFFDDVPEATRSIRRVEIARTPGGKTEPAALTLGWLASRLGWRFASRGFALDAAGGGIELAVVDDLRSDVGLGELVAIRIRAELGEALESTLGPRAAPLPTHASELRSLELSVGRTEAPRTLCWKVAGARSDEHLHPMGFRDETWVLVKVLDDRKCDDVYRASVLAAADWGGK